MYSIIEQVLLVDFKVIIIPHLYYPKMLKLLPQQIFNLEILIITENTLTKINDPVGSMVQSENNYRMESLLSIIFHILKKD